MRQSGSEPSFTSDDWSIIGHNCYDYAFGDKRRHASKSEPGGYSNFLFKTCGRGRNSMKNRILSDNPKYVYALSKGKECIPCRNGYYKVMSFVAPKNTVGEVYGDFHFYKQVGSVRYQIQRGDTVPFIARFFRVRPQVVRDAMARMKFARSSTNGVVTMNTERSLTGRIITFPVNLWAHKLGWGTRPLLVDSKGRTIMDPRKASRKYGFDYKTLCGTYCVRVGKAKTGNSKRV